MVRVAIASNHSPAMTAGKIFFGALESPRHAVILAQPIVIVPRNGNLVFSFLRARVFRPSRRITEKLGG
jgi:hypothetical protein